MNLLEHMKAWLYDSRRKLATAGMGAILCLIGYHVIFGANGFLVMAAVCAAALPFCRQPAMQ